MLTAAIKATPVPMKLFKYSTHQNHPPVSGGLTNTHPIWAKKVLLENV